MCARVHTVRTKNGSTGSGFGFRHFLWGFREGVLISLHVAQYSQKGMILVSGSVLEKPRWRFHSCFRFLQKRSDSGSSSAPGPSCNPRQALTLA